MSDDHEIDLGKLSDREILILLAQGQKVMHGRLNDHGSRLRALETFRNWAAGAGAAGAVIAAMFGIKLKASQG